MEFFRRILNGYRRWVNAFYRGPSWLWGNEVREGKYVSPTLALFLWLHGLCSRVFTFQGWMLFWVWLATAFYATVMLRSPVMILRRGYKTGTFSCAFPLDFFSGSFMFISKPFPVSAANSDGRHFQHHPD